MIQKICFKRNPEKLPAVWKVASLEQIAVESGKRTERYRESERPQERLSGWKRRENVLGLLLLK